jgi:hypothetical protein
MNPILRVVLLAFFIGGTAGLLAIPIINASDEIIVPTNGGPSPTPVATEEPTPEPLVSQSPAPMPELSYSSLGYPKACLRPSVPLPNLGHIAFDDGDGVVIADLDSGARMRLSDEMGPIDWSASGKYLVVGNGLVYDSAAQPVGALTFGFGQSVWSPTSDCLVTVGTAEIKVFTPPKSHHVALFGAAVRNESVYFDRGGTRLAITFDKKRLVYDLTKEDLPRRHRMQRGVFCGNEVLSPYSVPGVGDAIAPIACSPDGGFIAAIMGATHAPPDLELFRRDGSHVDDMAPDGNYMDLYAVWGRRGTGLLFVRENAGASSAPELWFIPEGGSARDTGLRPRKPRGAETWDDIISWSAAVPDGVADDRGGS